VRIVDCDNEEHEAERTVRRIQSLREAGLSGMTHGGLGKDWKDFAILYRANHQARIFEQALRKAQIPYKVSGGQSFFDRAEIRDLCAWLRLWVNEDDDPAFLRCVTTPKRGIGHQTLASLGTFANQYKLSLFGALFSSSLAAVLSARAVGSLQEFGRYLNDLQFRAKPHRRRGGRQGVPARVAQGHRLREAPVRQRGEREAGRLALDQRAGVLRLDGRALRRRDRRHRGRPGRQREEDPAGSGADHRAAVHHQRAREGPERGDAVHAARGQGPGVAARDAGGLRRGHAAVQAGRRRQRAARPTAR
jgi:hypothetical protein